MDKQQGIDTETHGVWCTFHGRRNTFKTVTLNPRFLIFTTFIKLFICQTGSGSDKPKFFVNTQTSSNAHISSGMCPEGMSNLRHLWLAGREEWRKGKGEGTWEEGGKVLTLTPSLCAANTGTN